MLVAGSDDGVYRVSGLDGDGGTTAEKVLDSGRVVRVRQFDGVAGVFAATATGLYHSADCRTWTNLGVPRERVYAVAADPAGDRLYAGTRPAHVYAADAAPAVGPAGGVATDGGAEDVATGGGTDAAGSPAGTGSSDRTDVWEECEGFQALPSREEWRTPRHEDVAQVRSLRTHPGAPDRVVAAVEVGGVHVSEDGGATWAERTDGVDDDVHHLHLAGADEFVAATGFGLYRTEDAGRSWIRLDAGDDRRYFREAFTHEGVVYAGGANGPSSTWDETTDHALFEYRDGRLDEVASPTPDELAIGWCVADGDVLAATHCGSLLARRDGEFRRVGSVPVPGEVRGRYLPLTWVGDR